MGFTAGTEVIVVSLNRRGEIETCLRAGVYRVRVGGMTTTAREADLRPATVRQPRPAPQAAPELPAEPRTGRATGEGAPATLDLHGLTVDEARNRVAAYISRAILAGLDRVEIVHGIGTGRLKKAVTADLKKIGAVRRVTPHPTNPGALIAYL